MTDRSPFELAREAIDLAERQTQFRPPVKSSLDEDEVRWLFSSHADFVQRVGQLTRRGLLHVDIAHGMHISEPQFSKLYNRGFERSNQIVYKHIKALDELIVATSLKAVNGG